MKRKSQIIKVYISENAKYEGHNLYHALVKICAKMDMAGVTVLRGIEGFGHEKNIRSTRLLQISSELPIVVEIVDDREKIAKILPHIKEMVTDGLITLNELEVIKYGKNDFGGSKEEQRSE